MHVGTGRPDMVENSVVPARFDSLVTYAGSMSCYAR